MLQFFLTVLEAMRKRLSNPPAMQDDGDVEAWRRDPLSHPAIAAMNQRELADLPFKPRSGKC
ncbi:hypothetical protein [Chelativorans sp. AA-79]|uniref:hypothetical protein n=1 Tax=Chelativorans sp. AA-79 TaxID=3028735 RepID=UPI0023F9F018|nr:hypothetical protein [Chelativorans sp. AA-79]WEX07920.1 hypothetical protein PVE73_17705 [Chelativorans sp. AA-79]